MRGYRVFAAPGIDGETLARAIAGALPAFRPSQGKEALEAKLGPGALLRWRRHRAAFLSRAPLPFGDSHVKIYGAKDVLEVAIETITRSRGTTSWRMGRALFEVGVPTPEPVLLLVRKPARIHRESVLVTRSLENPVLLTAELKARLASARETAPLLDEVARLAARLHLAGFFHGDFTASNLVLSGPPEARRLSVIDLDRTKLLRVLPRGARRWIQALDLRMLLLTTWGEVPREAWLTLLGRYLAETGIAGPKAARFSARVLSARRGRVRLGANAPTKGGREPWGERG